MPRLLWMWSIVCHGVPSEKIFLSYFSMLERKYEGKIKYFTFRDKKIGWGINGKVVLSLKNKKTKSVKLWQSGSSYLYYFIKGWLYRENCYRCKYAGKNRPGDITLGDYWGIEKQHPEYLNGADNTFYNNKRITQFAYRNAKLIACGEMVKKNLVDYFDFNASQVTVIHNAIEKFDDEVVVDKTLKKLKEDGFYLVGNVGRFAEQKGMEYFIKSYPMIKKKTDRIKYILIGDGVDREKLKSLVNQLAEGNTELLVSSLKRSMKITGLVCGLLIAGFFSYGTPFLRLWLTDSQNISLIFKISMIVLFSDIVIGVVNPLYYVYTLTNKLRLPCYITLAMGTANIIGMYVLIKYTSLGEYAVVLTTMVLNLIHLIDAPIYSAYCLKIKISTFYPVILRHLIACVVNVILIRVLAGVLPYPSSWLILCVDCLIVGVCALLVEFIVLFDRNEISEFARKVKNKIA